MLLLEIASLYKPFVKLYLLKTSLLLKRTLIFECIQLTKDLIYTIKSILSGGLHSLSSINGFNFGRYIFVKVLPVLIHMLGLQLYATECSMKQETLPPFLARSSLIRS